MLGTTLQDRYHLTHELGRGAMGTVYRARDRMLDRDVAVKVISPALFDDAGRARFLREARAVGRLNHPHIVTLYDVAEHEGAPFLVLEVIEGGSLRDVLPLRPDAALVVARQLCDALAHAHARGVVHRDVKPENVLLLRRDGALHVKLMDFGLSSAQGASRVTRPGMVLGTLAYIAPEQAMGAAADGRADLYSLGVLLYEAVTGRVPFRGGNAPALIAQHLKAVPTPPRAHNPQVSAELERFILQLLAKDPDDRPANALAALERIAALAGATPSPAGLQAARPAKRIHLPEPATPYVARPRDLAALLERCARSESRLLTLTGPGGTGKTRLALRLAAELAPAHPDGAVFVELGALSDPSLVPATLARALELPEPPRGDALASVRTHLAGRAMLLVLDNFEQLLPAAADVAGLVRDCPGVRAIVTSRERLHIGGEVEYAVKPLESPEEGAKTTAARVAQSPAAALFVLRAQASRPEFELNDANASAVAHICRRLDGLPLAIELAAARVRFLPPAAIARELGEFAAGSALDVLTGGAADAPSRQRTQRAAIAWSHALLDDTERRVFRRLAVFHGSFALATAGELCADPGVAHGAFLDALGSLVDKNLVTARETSEGEARFELLQTVREFAAEQLAEAGEGRALERRHFECLLALAETAGTRIKGAGQAIALDGIERDLPNLRAALARASTRGEHADALRLCTALRWFWLMRGYSTEGRSWFARLLAPDGLDPALRAEGLHAAGNLAQNQGDLRAATAAFEESLALYRALGDRRGIAGDLGNLGLAALDRADYAAARRLLEEGLALRRALGDESGEADALHNLTLVAIGEGDLAGAQDLGERSLAKMKQLGNSHHASACISCLGQIALYRGELADAGALLEESLAMRRALNDDHCSGNSLNLLGQLALQRDDAAQARALLEESVRLLLKAGARGSLAGALEGLAAAELASGHALRAAELLGAAEAVRETSGAARSPREAEDCAGTLAALRTAADDRALRDASARGRVMPVETLVGE